jgi:hypothetical protein
VDDVLRNDRICDDVVDAVNGGRPPLVLTERNDHLDRRCRGYEATGYRILLPASVRLRSRPVRANSGETSPEPWRRRAISGWPADVVLPSDPVWKRDCSGSALRLVRDGVDTPVASPFVHPAGAQPPTRGSSQARGC